MDELLPANQTRRSASHLPSTVVGAVTLDNALPGDEGEVRLREYWRIFFKYRYLIAGVFSVCLILSFLYILTATPLYSAQSKIRISTYEPILTATKIEDLLQQRSKEANYLETQIEEIKSFSLADKVLEDSTIRGALEGKATRSFLDKLQFWKSVGELNPEAEVDQFSTLAGYQAPIPIIKKYVSMLQILPVRRTSLVVIQATAKSPSMAALIANKHALTYIDWVRANRIDQQSRGLSFLRSQADELREKVADIEREMADYAEANSIVAVNKDENITAQKMSQLNKMLTEATSKKIEAENRYQQANEALKSESAGFDDDSLQTMRSDLVRLQGEYQQLSAKFTSSYPKMQQLKSQIDALKQAIAAQRRQIVNGLKAKALAAQNEEINLKEELEQQKSRTFELSKKEVQYNVLNRELTSSRELLQNILKQIKETSLAVESNSSNVSVVDYASAPKAPNFPRKVLSLTIGGVVGLLLGLALACLLAYLDNTIKTPEDVIATVRLPNLGAVPSFDLEGLAADGSNKTETKFGLPQVEAASSDLPIVYMQAPKSLAAEAYRTIRTAILLSKAGEPPRTLLVTSSQSSEGKTTSSINLAASLASAGGRVVLIDADLRRPSMHRHLKVDHPTAGLVDILTGQKTFEEVALKDVTNKVTVVLSGSTPPNPAELLGSLEMATLIDQLAAIYDYVIIDSPPILPVTDSVILSRYVDGVLLVVKAHSTPKKVVTDAKNSLRAVGANVIGTILNDVDFTGGDYYYYNRYYQAYHQDSATVQSKTGQSKKGRAAGI